MTYTLIEKSELAREYLKGTYLFEVSADLLKEFFYDLSEKFDRYGDDLGFNFHEKNPLFLNEFCKYVDKAYLTYEESALPYLKAAFEFNEEELKSFSLKLIFAKELFDAMKQKLEEHERSSDFMISIGSSEEGGSYHLSLYSWAYEPKEVSFVYNEDGRVSWL